MSGEPAEISELTQAEDCPAASEGESELQHWWFQQDQDEQYTQEQYEW